MAEAALNASALCVDEDTATHENDELFIKSWLLQ
jgi:hypothetical protein